MNHLLKSPFKYIFYLKGLFFFLVFSFSFDAITQTGPGGVGNASNNAFWVRADAGTSTTTNGQPISLWQDFSGNSNDISQATLVQRPVYTSVLMNGYPAVLFDYNNTAGQNDFLSGVDASNLDNTNGLTIFSVIRPTNLGSARSIIAKRTNVGVNQAYMFFFFTSDYCHVDIVSNDNRFSTSPIAYPVATNYILSMHYDGTLAAASRAKIYNGQALVVTASESAATIPDYDSPLIVGSTHIGDNRAFGGYMAEIIIYREALGTARKMIVDNYLSAKYNIPLTANDIYTMDNPGNGNYDHDVAGIGRLSATDLNTDAQGTGIVRISNPSSMANNEFLMWGHDNGILQAINSTDIPAGVQARFDRVWRVSQVNQSGAAVDVGSINMSWDLNGLGPVTASDLRLLIDTDNDGIFTDETPIAGAVNLGGGIYQFNAVTGISNQRRFTLATININQTPLPIELVRFDATAKENKTVLLEWETLSERNNDYFTLERSADGMNWEELGIVDGAGTSSVSITYQFIDQKPLFDKNYYRLKQTDFDGAFTYSAIRFVRFTNSQIVIYPNPTNGIVNISGLNSSTDYFVIKNQLGQLVFVSDLIKNTSGNDVQIDLSDLPSGVYFLRTSDASYRIVKQ